MTSSQLFPSLTLSLSLPPTVFHFSLSLFSVSLTQYALSFHPFHHLTLFLPLPPSLSLSYPSIFPIPLPLSHSFLFHSFCYLSHFFFLSIPLTFEYLPSSLSRQSLSPPSLSLPPFFSFLSLYLCSFGQICQKRGLKFRSEKHFPRLSLKSF